jgi:septum formation protein
LELLRLVVPPETIEVLPPRSADELSFDELHDWNGIANRLTEVARSKCDDVLTQIESRGPTEGDDSTVVIAADTIIVATDNSEQPRVLGQPPEDDSWCETVRDWFVNYLIGRTHVAATSLQLAGPHGTRVERLVQSEVTFRPGTECWLDWYLATGEPRGKAGGYALQGAGSVFVSYVEGSLSNVVGLPLEALLEAADAAGIVTRSASFGRT